MSGTSPPELLRLFNASDASARESAWAAFVKVHSRLLLHTAHSLGGGYDAAMDRYSYVLAQLQRDDFRRLRRYAADGRGKFSTWLVVVARRLCLDHHRQRYGRVRDREDRAEHDSRRRLADLVTVQIDLTQIQDSSAADPESDYAALELRGNLESVLAGLEPRDRLLLRLRFDDELPASEIARVMGFPTPFHVYRRLNHLLGELRVVLTRKGVVSPAV